MADLLTPSAQTAAVLKIDWLVDLMDGDWNRGFTSIYASNRYRVIIPATGLRALGHRVRLLPMATWSAQHEPPDLRPDIVVVAKLFRREGEKFGSVSERVLTAIAAARSSNIRVIADFCDDLLDHPDYGAHWRALSTSVDACLAGSDELAKAIRGHSTVPVHVVGDPIAAPRLEPRVFRRPSWIHSVIQRWLGAQSAPRRLRLVWFGHPSNSPPALEWAARLLPLSERQPWVLTLVTTRLPDIERLVQAFNQQHAPRALLRLVPWSEAAQWEAVQDADAVLIPGGPQVAVPRAKTSNRLTDALASGRFVVASPIPAYLPYGAYVAITEDPLAALNSYLSDPGKALAKVTAGQAAAEQRASQPVITAHWLGALKAVLGSPTPAVPPDAHGDATVAPAVRLNLGCGDKILPGYVNVDVVEARAGKSPDVICDLRDLSVFPDNHADEVLAVHVVEHFWRWEVEAVLREWIRVLKPGGRMVLECPNLAAACEAFLADPLGGSQSDGRGQRTMWVFYGDPQWQDPLMVHRWGYTPSSLSALMATAGLVNARQEPAQFKLREPRDMRVVAEKPVATKVDASLAPHH